MNDFSEFLYALRKEKGMTQAELATLLGVTNKAVSKWETGEAMPETSLLLPISRIFGVTVDELLEGKRNINNESTEGFQSKQSDENSSKGYNFKDEDFDYIKRHIFTREKEDEKTTLEKIGALVCACLFSLGMLTYLILGVVGNLWTPYWILIPLCSLSCGIIGIVFDLCNAKKRKQKLSRGENPYVGAICGIVMLLGIMAYLILGVFFSLWHPYWILIVACAFICSAIGIIGSIFSIKTNKE